MATIFPSVKAVGEGLGDKIFYLTAKIDHKNGGRTGISTLKGKNWLQV